MTAPADPIDAGLRALQATQKPGQCFSPWQIAKALNVPVKEIQDLELMALQHAMFLLQEAEPEGLAEALGKIPMVEISRRQAEMCACSQKGKALATAERMRRYRERLKASPERQAELKRKKAEAQRLWRVRRAAVVVVVDAA